MNNEAPGLRIYVSGLHSGPNPSPGVGVARSLRAAYPDSEIIGVDYSARSSGIHWPDFNDVWIQRPWTELDLGQYADQIGELFKSESLWISGLDLETLWLAEKLGPHPDLLVPTKQAIRRTAKPDIRAHHGLPVHIPEFAVASGHDSSLHAFGRRHGWRTWLKGPNYEARRVSSWREFEAARADLEQTWSTRELSLQRHIAGYGESVAFCAFQGELLGCVLMEKRESTTEGKAWAGQVRRVPDEFRIPLAQIVSKLHWTGGGELEMIRDSAGVRWLIEWNPRFPAWIHGSTIGGMNLPALLVERATGKSARPNNSSAEFARVVIEIPVRDGFPLLPVLEPRAGSANPSSKHPSGMPALARRLESARRKSEGNEAPQLPPTMAEDFSLVIADPLETPQIAFLPSTARELFETAASLAEGASKNGLRVTLAYSVKTNPDVRLLDLARRNGLLAETISQLEVDRALSAGFTAEDIVLNGPGKWWPRREKFSYVSALFCDSLEELNWVASRISSGEQVAEVIGIRLRPPGLSSRFGISIEEADIFHELLTSLRELPPLHPIGVSFHSDLESLGVGRWRALAGSMVRWASAIGNLSGRVVECLDIGGGWFSDDWFRDLRAELPSLVREVHQQLPGCHRLILEPGRALAQPSAGLLTSVLEVRHLNDSVVEVVVDGSISELPEILRHPHRIAWCKRATDSLRVLATGDQRVVGRTCMEADILSNRVALPRDIEVGDWVVFADAGAYDRSTGYVFGRG